MVWGPIINYYKDNFLYLISASNYWGLEGWGGFAARPECAKFNYNLLMCSQLNCLETNFLLIILQLMGVTKIEEK